MAQPAARTQKTNPAEILVALVCALALTITVMMLAMLPAAGHLASSCDFVAYWATGGQLAHHANPYDPVAMARIEHAAGFTGAGAYYMRNPPWALPLALPLGWLPIRDAVLPWSLLMLAVLVVSVSLVWKLAGTEGRGPLAILGYAFPPALLCVVLGQTSLFALLGLVLFLRLHRTKPFRAGAALWLCALKPHLFLPFGIVLLVWIAITRSYRIVLGAGAALVVSCLLTLWIDPRAFAEYLQWAHASGIGSQPVPCLGALLRRLDPSAAWLPFIPAAAGCLWAGRYFYARRDAWDWVEHGSVLALVSVVVAPYCFLFDQCLAIPALLYAASRTSSSGILASLAVLYCAVEMQPLVFGSPAVSYWTWLLAAPAWLLWFVWARASAHRGVAETAASFA
jgi:hypothetical protein